MPKSPHTVGGSSSPCPHQGRRRAGCCPARAARMGCSSPPAQHLGSRPATAKVNHWDMVTASCCCEHLIFNSSEGFFSTVPPHPPHPQGKAVGTHFWSSQRLAACLTVRDERGVTPASPGGCCPGAPPDQLLSEVSFQGWDTRGTPRAEAASWLSGICLHQQSWGQALSSLFSQRLHLLL